MAVEITKSSKDKWDAWFNMMPPGPPTLHVKGTVDVGDEGTGATLEFGGLEKVFPPNLLLKIVPSTIFIPRPDGDTKITLHYSSSDFSPGLVGDIKVHYPNGDVHVIPNSEIGMAH